MDTTLNVPITIKYVLVRGARIRSTIDKTREEVAAEEQRDQEIDDLVQENASKIFQSLMPNLVKDEIATGGDGSSIEPLLSQMLTALEFSDDQQAGLYKNNKDIRADDLDYSFIVTVTPPFSEIPNLIRSKVSDMISDILGGMLS